MYDVKNYLGQFFTGQPNWGAEISRRHEQKLFEAQDPANISECKHRLMELRREVAAKEAHAACGRLAKLQVTLKEKEESNDFFLSQAGQVEAKLRTLESLAPESEASLPNFERPYKLRTAKETDTITKVVRAIKAARADESVADALVPPKSDPKGVPGNAAFGGGGQNRAFGALGAFGAGGARFGGEF